MEESTAVVTELKDRIRCITLQRPEKKNALTLAMYAAMCDALHQADTDDAVRVILIAAAGDCFCSGNDVMDFLMAPPADESSPAFAFLTALCNARKPLIAAVQGPAIGIGTTMLLHCDLVYASPQARFKMPFVSLGLCPEAGSSLLLPKLMGRQRAAQYILLGEEFNAQAAFEAGLVNAIAPEGGLLELAMEQAQRLAEMPPHTMRTAKALLKRGYEQALHETIAEEGRLFMEAVRSPEAAEALQAFLQHRKPDFSAF